MWIRWIRIRIRNTGTYVPTVVQILILRAMGILIICNVPVPVFVNSKLIHVGQNMQIPIRKLILRLNLNDFYCLSVGIPSGCC